MSFYVNHPYHLVDESPWPILSSAAGLMTTLGLVKLFTEKNPSLVFNGLFCILVSMYFWWEDTSSEGSLQGLHTFIVQKGLRWGMALFIVSEIFFFLSFFWAFFHSSLGVSHILMEWPPLGFFVFNPWQVPLLNTLVLLSSGVTVTWSHYEILKGNHNDALLSLALTVILGFYFTCLQALEYYEATFSLADSVYGGCFFVATGFHGLHVIVGSIFLLVCLWRGFGGAFSAGHHFGFEAAAWYWHFVDVVWLFLFVSIYWWGKL